MQQVSIIKDEGYP